MEHGDDWLALDKLYHVLFGFCATIIFTLLASRTRYAFIRNRSTWVGSVLALMAGASKEVADEMGYFKSAGASDKDAVADLFGTLIAVFALWLTESFNIPAGLGSDYSDQVKRVEMV